MSDDSTGAGTAHEQNETDAKNENRSLELKGPEKSIALDQNPTRAESDVAIAKDESQEMSSAGFAPFRMWFNKNVRSIPNGVSLRYAGTDYLITELTNDGRLRLEAEGRAVLLPFDERYIPDVLGQLLPEETHVGD